MAKYFLGSIGDAEAYRVTTSLSGETTMDLVFTSKTLTDSAVNISVNKEQIIDSYNGAPAGVFYHSPNVSITLSDILWNPKFVESSLGGKFSKLCEAGNIESHSTVIETDSNGEYTFTGAPYPTPLGIPGIDNGSVYLINIKKISDSDWNELSSRDYNSLNHKISNLEPNTSYCIKYQTVSNQSSVLTVTTNIVPDELFLIITTPVFMAEGSFLEGTSYAPQGTSFNISSGKMAGKIVYEVPRWALDGDLSFNFSASGTSGMQLTGNVLESIENEEEPVFMRLREFITPRVWYEGLIDIITSNSMTRDITPEVMGMYADGSVCKIDYSVNNIMLIFKANIDPVNPPANPLVDDPNGIFVYDGIKYNVSGRFVSGVGEVVVKPAIVVKEEHGIDTLIILENISCTYNITDSI